MQTISLLICTLIIRNNTLDIFESKYSIKMNFTCLFFKLWLVEYLKLRMCLVFIACIFFLSVLI